ncbi:MAG TPA: Gfo/Idh/MocA family oxidoreductase [Polyangiaceae bacterium]|nr:Gfo/Idh/MocA family oxidoreductase [Polyangiaceae bacterium]
MSVVVDFPGARRAVAGKSSVKRCLFVGLGGIGQRHLRNLRELRGEGVAVDAYRVRREQAVVNDTLQVVPGEEVEKKYGVSVFDDLDAALAQRPDVVFVTNPSSLHVEITRRALEASAHVFVEKPLSHSLDGVGELVKQSQNRGLVGYVAYQLRFHPGFVRTSEVLTQGLIGRPLFAEAVVGEYLPGFHPYEDYRRMYASRRDLGGGVTLSQIHEIDFLIALLGRPERVFSLGGKLSSLEVDVDDVSSSLLEFRGAEGRVLPVRLHQDFLQRPGERRCVLVGEQGKLEWSLSGRSLRRWNAQGELCESHDFSEFPRNQLFLAELSHFFECVERGATPNVSLGTGAESLAVALAILESQQSGMPVNVGAVLDRAGLLPGSSS